MKYPPSSVTYTGLPLPHARPKPSLKEEDAFMEEHGGKGSRAIFLIVEFVSRLSPRRPACPPELRRSKRWSLRHRRAQ